MSRRARIVLWLWGVLNTLLAGLCSYTAVCFFLGWQRKLSQGPESDIMNSFTAAIELACLELFASITICALLNAVGCFLLGRRKRTGYWLAWSGWCLGLAGIYYALSLPGDLGIVLPGTLYAAGLLALYWLADVRKMLPAQEK